MQKTKTRTARPSLHHLRFKTLQPSGNDLQARRRSFFTSEELEELAESIRVNGILQPLLVRRKTKTIEGEKSRASFYEIVAGERRFMAGQLAGLKTAPCYVVNLTDREAVEAQIHENLHRKNSSPMEEAAAYLYFQEELELDPADIAVRVSKSREYVDGRLALNKLGERYQKDVAAEILPIGHALEIAKFPIETQPDVADLVSGYRYDPADGVKSLAAFQASIKSKILRELKRAPFSTRSPDLGSVPCEDCPKRTGAAPTLWGETEDLGSCLDSDCWSSKEIAHQEQLRETIAAAEEIETQNVPVIKMESGIDVEEIFPGAPVLETARYNRGEPWTEVDGKKNPCPGAEKAVRIGGDQTGQAVAICRAGSGCPVHYPKTEGSTGSGDGLSSYDLEQRRIRKEEILDQKVREPLRLKVLAAWISRASEIEAPEDDIAIAALARLWSTAVLAANDYHVSKWLGALVINNIEGGFDALANDLVQDASLKDWETLNPIVEQMDLDKRARLQRALLYFDLCAMPEAGSYRSQKEIQALAVESDFDYQLEDAKLRVELCAARQKKVFEAYLIEILEADSKGQPRPELLRVYSKNFVARGDREEDN